MSNASRPTSPFAKRVKLESDNEMDETIDEETVTDEHDEELDGDYCSICLQLFVDRSVIPECSHEFCFDCILTWTGQSRRCPLCTRTIGPYLIHHIRSNFDYQKYHLPPLRSSPPPIRPLRPIARPSASRRTARERQWGRRERRERDVVDELERAIDRRRWVYHNHLYAKHVASNTFTRYRPFPTPAQFAASQDYVSRATVFIRRELRVWVSLDVEFLTTFILSLLKAIDIRSESAVKLLAEFLDMDIPYAEGRRFPNAEQFAHELYSYLRSPYKSLSAYDANVQYDIPKDNRRLMSAEAEGLAQGKDHGLQSHLSQEPQHVPSFRNGGGPSQPNLNNCSPSDDLQLDSSHLHIMLPNVREEEVRPRKWSGPTVELTGPPNSLIEASPSHTNLYTLPHASMVQSSDQRNRAKGKQRAESTDDLATPVTYGHSHVDSIPLIRSPINVQALGGDAEDAHDNISTTKTSGREGAHHRDNRHRVDPLDQLQRLPASKSTETKQFQIRTRRDPLLIARAHLTKARGNTEAETSPIFSTHSADVVIAPTVDHTELKRNPRRMNECPSLLSRITGSLAPHEQPGTNPTLTPSPAVTTNDPIYDLDSRRDGVDVTASQTQLTADRTKAANRNGSSRNGLACTAELPSSARSVTEGNNTDARLRLLRRLEAEKAQQSVVKHTPASGDANCGREDTGANVNEDSHIDFSHSAPGPVGRLINDSAATTQGEAYGPVETEAKLRARVRLRMKLAIEKSALSPTSPHDRAYQAE